MPNQAIILIARQWFDALNQHNLEKLLALYHDKAQHYSSKLKARNPETNGLIKGKQALSNWWSDSFQRLPTLQYKPTRFIAEDNAIFMEYTRHVDWEETITVGEVLDIADGLIIASRVYHS